MSLEGDILANNTNENEEDIVTIDNVTDFSRFLSSAAFKSDKKRKYRAEVIGVHLRVFSRWENGEGFPSEDKLPLLAKAYEVDLEELKKAYRRSKKARELEKDNRKNPKHKQSVSKLPTIEEPVIYRGYKGGKKA